MMLANLLKISFFTIAFTLLTINAPSTHAQIIALPNCDTNPLHPFCQSQCAFVTPLPSWCEISTPETNPIIIIPGLLASLNLQVTTSDNDGGIWSYAPFAENIYRGLTERLETAGFEQGKDLFIAHYDWRQSNTESAVEFLQPIIEQAKQATGAEKVDIIAHSMGGLVARQYIQGPNYQDDVDQLITLGTPHLGAADAYVTWEGGILPEKWSPWMKGYMGMIEATLQSKNVTLMSRPESFRTFFPSLRDLLPINNFTSRDNQLIATSELTEQNLFLQQLDNTVSNLTDNVNLKTIAGTSIETLSEISLSTNRSIIDILLNRWRDGHAEPDPPPVDTTDGDKTVTLASAHIGTNNLTLNNVEHDKLPEAAQVEVLEALSIETTGPMLTYDLPDSVLATVILSPVDPIISGPNGEVISSTQNTFPEAEYVDDPTDPDGPKLLVIANPPEGDYELNLTGTNTGDYTVITSYADEDETKSTTQDGTTTVGQTNTYTFSIDNETFVPDVTLLELTEQLRQTIKQLNKTDHKDKHKHLSHHGKLLGATNKLHNQVKKYTKSLDKYGTDNKKTRKDYEKLTKAFNEFSRKLDQEITKEHLDETAVQQILPLRDAIQNAL